MALSLEQYSYLIYRSDAYEILEDRLLEERQESPIIADEIGEVLPENLIVEILSFLPVKALLQYKSVCKLWYSIITSSNFISKHLQNYYNKNDGNCLLVHFELSRWPEVDLCALLIDETPKVLALDYIEINTMLHACICGPCDGIYYLYTLDDDGDERALWNPAINELKMLPPIVEHPYLPSNLFKAMNEVYGFGYDPLTKDYKVVVVQGDWWSKIDVGDDDDEIVHQSSVFVYTLGTDSWRYWGDLARNYKLCHNRCYIVVNRCLYWLSLDEAEVIICFDLGSEECHEIATPNYEGDTFNKSLGVFNDTIAFLCVHNMDEHFDILTLNDDGFWTKIFTIGPIPGLWNPIGHWKSNKFLLQSRSDIGDLLLCDIDTQEMRDIGLDRSCCCRGVFVYKESLVSFRR